MKKLLNAVTISFHILIMFQMNRLIPLLYSLLILSTDLTLLNLLLQKAVRL